MVTISSPARRNRMAASSGDRRGSGRRPAGEGRRLTMRIAAAIAALLLVLVGGLWLAGFFSPPAEVRAFRTAVDEQVSKYDQIARGGGSFVDVGDNFRPMMQMARDIPEQYRDEIRGQMGRVFDARERAEVVSFFALPPAMRQAELDRRIRAQEARRAAWQADRAQRGGRPPGGGGPGRGGPGGNDSPRNRGGSEEQRIARRVTQLSQTSPERRAQRDEYRRLMQDRQNQLGISGGRRW